MAKRDSAQVLEALLASYSGYFDVSRDQSCAGVDFVGVAQFHSHGEKYVLSKKAKIWEVENHEYAFIAYVPLLDAAELDRLKAVVVDEGLRLIEPSSRHMYSYLTLAVVAEEITPDAKSAIEKISFSRSFLFNLHGWTELRVVALDLLTDDVLYNRKGRELKELFSNK